MKLDASKRLKTLTAADWRSQMETISDDKVKDVVKHLSSLVNIQWIQTDGYDSGCEVQFDGKTSSDISYGDKCLSAKDMLNIANLVKGIGMVELLPGEDGGFTLILAN